MKSTGILLFLVLLISVISCDPQDTQINKYTYDDLAHSPVLTPSEALRSFYVKEGVVMDLVASEPLIHDPVAMTFDPIGRIWVVEMKGYMPDLEGNLEDTPVGSIKILTDTDGDGQMDQSKIFLDSLVLPRAIALVYGGLLYAEPPNLWFVDIARDRPVNKFLIDSSYAVGGNVEHQPNGLMVALDNWIYNAKSSKRYRRNNGVWIIEETEFRGQWGITQNRDGLLFYNTNSDQLQADLIPSGYLIRNPALRSRSLHGIQAVTNQRVYPMRPTGINRGYSEGMLDSLGVLTSFTAASGPVIFYGDGLPEEYQGNAFVPEPAGNLVKRNFITEGDLSIHGRQAYSDSEFLVSVDERFRPVNLYNGPDGALYVVDMYRGVIQHITYLTNYLKDQIRDRNLDKPTGLGRIYRIRSEDTAMKQFKEEIETRDLLDDLGSENYFLALQAQSLLCMSLESRVRDQLTDVLVTSRVENQRVHALWTLECRSELETDLIMYLLDTARSQRLRHHAFRVLHSSFSHSLNTDIKISLYGKLIQRNEPGTDALVLLELGNIQSEVGDVARRMMSTILLRHHGNSKFHEMALSGLASNEEEFVRDYYPTDTAFSKLASETIQSRSTAMRASNIGSRGLYSIYCQSCHGDNGEGVRSLGPPLQNSEWVTGSVDRLIAISLFGITGPIEVNGQLYQPPEVAGEMVGVAGYEGVSNNDLAAILNYVRNNWGNEGSIITASDVRRVRLENINRKRPFQIDEIKLIQ